MRRVVSSVFLFAFAAKGVEAADSFTAQFLQIVKESNEQKAGLEKQAAELARQELEVVAAKARAEELVAEAACKDAEAKVVQKEKMLADILRETQDIDRLAKTAGADENSAEAELASLEERERLRREFRGQLDTDVTNLKGDTAAPSATELHQAQANRVAAEVAAGKALARLEAKSETLEQLQKDLDKETAMLRTMEGEVAQRQEKQGTSLMPDRDYLRDRINEMEHENVLQRVRLSMAKQKNANMRGGVNPEEPAQAQGADPEAGVNPEEPAWARGADPEAGANPEEPAQARGADPEAGVNPEEPAQVQGADPEAGVNPEEPAQAQGADPEAPAQG